MTTWPLTDMHIHATRYRLSGEDATMSVANIASTLDALHYRVAGIVEHLDTHPKHPVACLESLVEEFCTVRSDVRLYVGAELDYQGSSISVPDAPEIKERLGLDYYLAAAHGVGDGVSDVRSFIDDHHRRLMGILQCDYVDIVAHPWVEGSKFASRGQIEKWDFAMIPQHYLREFVSAAAEVGKAIEISQKVLPYADVPAHRDYLEMVREAGGPIVISSDSHHMKGLGSVASVSALLADAGFGPDRLWTPCGGGA